MILNVKHPIKRYCVARRIKQREFARVVGLSEGFISQLILGHEKCGRESALLIVERTGGVIRLEELLTWAPPGDTENLRGAA